jgi:RimJ/RimL family protein N-acetyltransferase
MKPFEPVVLKGPRVTLRWIRASDADALFSTLSGYETGMHLNFVIEPAADAAIVGMAGLFHFHETSRRAEIGYTLARAHWGQGLMHEALVALVDHAFSALDLNRLEADIDPRNVASARSLERLGFRHEALMRERWIVNGEVSDTGFYGLLRSEWQGDSR